MTKNILKKIVITTSRKSSSFIFGLEMLTKSRNNDQYQKTCHNECISRNLQNYLSLPVGKPKCCFTTIGRGGQWHSIKDLLMIYIITKPAYQHPPDTPQIFSRYFPGIHHINPRYPIYPQDIHQISPRYPKISSNFHKICPQNILLYTYL